ncbi:hypothetical protein [Phaeobacter inhibens]|uniref:hypothetical protein n=1 Tax=Phaeobacter inhibens TaxID=221822 RepID=UPI0021A37DB3|nr:hypothetical protein [Phaeobacter inhibens]UWR73150.1 hypothetical protein K4L00_03315 [Phaeobacter inhibens]
MADLFGEGPPYERHPITGVKLNVTAKTRPALDFIEAVTAHIMFFQGVSVTLIAQKLGTNPARVVEVFKGEEHPDAKTEAYRLLRAA